MRKGEKGNEKKRNEKKKRKEKNKRKEKKRKGKEERKDKKENKRGRKIHAWRRKEKKKKLRFPVFQRLDVVSSRIKVGLLDES